MTRPEFQHSIRRGEASDLPSVLELLTAAGLPTADLTSADGLQLWILTAGHSPQGVIALQRFGGDGLLRSLALARDYRHRGLGRELVARLERDASADGIAQLVLLTEAAEAFFSRLGYDTIDRCLVSHQLKQSSEFRSLCPASAVCMRKSLHS
jgi:amino-acid N-acetyltransferase